jgi:hypothetical protein
MIVLMDNAIKTMELLYVLNLLVIHLHSLININFVMEINALKILIAIHTIVILMKIIFAVIDN